jgi:hypothetical protein
VVDLGYRDEDGQNVTTLALKNMNQVVLPARRPPSGKRQGQILKLLEGEHASGNCVWSDGEVRRLATEKLGMHRNSARDAILSLHQAGYLRASVGGMTLANRGEATNG